MLPLKIKRLFNIYFSLVAPTMCDFAYPSVGCRFVVYFSVIAL